VDPVCSTPSFGALRQLCDEGAVHDKSLDSKGNDSDGAIRMSVGALTTRADVEAGVWAVRALAAEARS
jgi:hypothetical protein